MRAITVNREIEAPTQAVWDVLADFPNIAHWNGGVKKSYATSDETEGVGATRHCDLAPAGSLEETIREWAPLERLVITIDSASKVPIKQGRATFSLSATGDSATNVQIAYEFEPKWGILGILIRPVLDRQLRKGFRGFLTDLDAAAKLRA